MFSRIAVYLRQNNAFSRAEILTAIVKGFDTDWQTKEPMTKSLDRAANISEWLEPHIDQTPNVTTFRQFKIEKMDGEVVIWARRRCKEDDPENPWQSLEGKLHEPSRKVPFLTCLWFCPHSSMCVGI
jgi:hypothetical protein